MKTSSQASPTELSTFVINLALAVLLSYILSLVYIHWGSSLSNRRRFAANFMLITVTTTFIILVVRSSVALSLGLVGALSIVRFRAAIKEPEELAYLFFAIGIGIGLGDNQRLITVLAMVAAILILGAMAMLGATLTLPGIAGIVLTVGLAVDANVLIFERIREELKLNKPVRAAIDRGYSRALVTIVDANVTTLITAMVLLYFGTATVKGFAVTLSLGIIASMYTAIVVTRMVFDAITNRFELKSLSI